MTAASHDAAADRLTDEQIEAKLTALEGMILRERDWKTLPALNAAFQRLIAEQVRRELKGDER